MLNRHRRMLHRVLFIRIACVIRKAKWGGGFVTASFLSHTHILRTVYERTLT